MDRMSIKSLRKMAELNLCEKCFKTYKALVEPTIKNWLSKPLSNWRNVESNVTQMVMKLKGVFKTDLIFISLDEDSNEKYADEVDVETFQRIKKYWGFKRKIKYLKENGILENQSYTFLYKVSDIRNRIHDLFGEFSEQDRSLFYYADAITSQIYYATMFKWGERIYANAKANAEKVAEQLLSKIDEI